MMSSKDFRSLIVDPAAEQFRNEPTSLLYAYTIIWAIDSYASHIAMEKEWATVIGDPSKREAEERGYKDKLMNSPREGAWQFRIVREVSNAGKHALRSPRKKKKVDVENSNTLTAKNIDGWLSYFEGPVRSPHWGQQIVVDLDLSFDRQSNVWLDRNGKPFHGPFTKWVPVYGLISPSLALIEAGP